MPAGAGCVVLTLVYDLILHRDVEQAFKLRGRGDYGRRGWGWRWYFVRWWWDW
jgi:hypothetical protein